MLGNIGNLFVKCMQQVTKDYVMYRQRAQSVLSNIGKGQKTGLLILLAGSVTFVKGLWLEGGNFDVPP